MEAGETKVIHTIVHVQRWGYNYENGAYSGLLGDQLKLLSMQIVPYNYGGSLIDDSFLSNTFGDLIISEI